MVGRHNGYIMSCLNADMQPDCGEQCQGKGVL